MTSGPTSQLTMIGSDGTVQPDALGVSCVAVSMKSELVTENWWERERLPVAMTLLTL